jgi:hypothetical protein
MRLNRLLPVVAVVALLLPSPVHASQIVSFGQLGTTNTFIATNNGDGTTTLEVLLGGVSITNIVSGATDPNAIFEFTADSVDAASLLGPLVTQSFEGTFSLHNSDNSIQYLYGDFGAALMLGGNGGTGSLFTSNTAGLAPLNLFTDLPVVLGDPMSFSLSLSNVSPALGISGGTINSFTASYTGTADAELQQVPVPEPATLTLLGLGLCATAGAARKRLARR